MRGLLAPEGERSRLSVSGIPPITFEPGSIAAPRDPAVVGLNLEHDRYQPVGRAVAFERTPAGIVAEFAIADTPEGDDYLANPTKRKLSPELADIVRRGERGISARITGAAIVSEGAWASAGLFALGEVTEDDEPDEEPAEPDEEPAEPGEDETTDDAPASPGTEPAAPANPEEDAMTATATGFAAAQPTTEDEPTPVGVGDFAAAVALAARTGDQRELLRITEPERRAGLFALADVKYDAAATDAGYLATPQYLGDVYAGADYEDRYARHFASGTLDELQFKQRSWVQKPLVDKWTGNKTEIPSRAPQFAVETKAAQRFAGGLDIAREYYDFGKTEDVQAILTAMAESYRENADLYVGEELHDSATPLEVDLAENTYGVSEAVFKLVRGALAVRREGKTRPTVAYVADDLYEQLIFTIKDQSLEYLASSVGLESGTFSGFALEPDESLEPGSILVAAKPALKVLTLPGSPIRVNALALALGGVDEAMFGYVGVSVQRPEAIQLVTSAADEG